MGLYAYCVLPATQRPDASLTGLAGRPVAVVPVEDLAVWVSAIERPQPSLETVQAHNRVIEAAITEEVTPVPLRFGQWVEDEPALRAALAGSADRHRAWLHQFAGCLEFGLRLIEPTSETRAQDVQPVQVASGFEYMQALRARSRMAEQERQHAEQVHARVRESLAELVRAERVQDEPTAHAVITLAHLVARPQFDEYRARARQLREQLPALRLLLSGPWPPYSFAA